MENYKLISNGMELDINQDFAISLNYQINDILEPSKRFTDYSKTITLPGTPTNNKFFHQIFDSNVDNRNFNPNKRIHAQVAVGINQVFDGYMQLLTINNVNGEISYEIQITGQLKDFVNNLGDSPLSVLNMSEYNHTRNQTNITNSWDYKVVKNGSTVDIGSGGDGYVYSYIVRGDWTTDIGNSVFIRDLYPNPYAKTVVDKMFEYGNYTYTSTFFNSDYFKKLTIPFIGESLKMSGAELDRRTVKAGIYSYLDYVDLTNYISRGDVSFSNALYNNSLGGIEKETGTVDDDGTELTFTDTADQWANDIYTCDSTGYYNISFDGKIVPAVTHSDGKTDVQFVSGSFEYQWELYKVDVNGNSQLLDSSVIDVNDPNDVGWVQFTLNTSTIFDCSGGATGYYTDTDSVIQINPSAENVFMNAGDTILINFRFQYPSSINWAGLSDNQHIMRLCLAKSYDGAFTKMVIEPASNALMGNEEVDMNQILPTKYKMKEFFNDLVKMFNLVVMPNPDKESDLIIEPDNQFFNSRNRIKDWSKKVNNDSNRKKTPMSELDANKYLYTYASDSDLYNSLYESETDKIYGELSIDVLNDFSNKENTTELGIAPTPVASKYIDDRVAPFFVEEDDENFKSKVVKPRLLFYNGLVDCNEWFIRDDENSTPSTLYSYPYTGMFDAPNGDVKFDLGFGMTDKLFFKTNTVPANNLFNMFHKERFKNITDINSHLLELELWLTPHDIKDFDFRDTIEIDNSFYRLNNIKDYSPVAGEALTTVQLYKIHTTNLDIDTPYVIDYSRSDISCPDDAIAYIADQPYYGSPSGQEFTQDCCNSIGGFWNNNVCYVNPTFTDTSTSDGGIISSGFVINNGVPTTDSNPNIYRRNGNSINTLGVKVIGTNNYIPKSASIKMIIGDNNSVAPNVENSIIIGDNVQATESNTLYFSDWSISSTGINSTAYTPTDIYTTGATYSPSTGVLTLNDSNDGVIEITGLTTPSATVDGEIEIGTWNMDTTPNVNIPHSLSSEQLLTVRNVSVTIVNDAQTEIYPLTTNGTSSSSSASQGNVSEVNGTDFVLHRQPAGFFDGTDFDGTENRGWINFTYRV